MAVEESAFSAPEQLECTPNPANTEVTVHVPVIQSSTATLAIYDLLGNVVSTTDAGVRGDSKMIRISVADLAQGVYIVRLITDAKNTIQHSAPLTILR